MYMKKLVFSLLAFTFLLTAGFNVSALANETKAAPEQEKTVTLTQAQQAEIGAIHKELLAKQKQLIQKYVEFGALSKEKADQVNNHFEKHYERMEQNGFEFPQHRHQKHEKPE